MARLSKAVQVAAAAALAAMLAAHPADARRGGSFGSRGARTYYAPHATRLSPGYTPGVARSMTARPSYRAPGYAPYYAPSYQPRYAPAYRPRMGFGGGLLTGLVAGGLVGALFGHHGYGYGGYGGYGYGAGTGLLAFLIQLAVLAGIVWLVMRLFRRRGSDGAMPPGYGQPGSYAGDAYAAPAAYPPPPPGGDDIAVTPADQQAFERLLIELQDAFGHEDYGRLRAITTPEVMSYLAEELSDNATHGRRNEVRDTRLIDAEVSEAWREDDSDYATIAMRYESVDLMRDRATGAILPGSSAMPSETVELWTFIRAAGAYGGWKVSAIQEA